MRLSYFIATTIVYYILILGFAGGAYSQNTFHSKNIAVIGQDDFLKGGTTSDVWGVSLSGTPAQYYALSTINGGLSIAIVPDVSPEYYDEVAYVNADNYQTGGGNMEYQDVETFVVNGMTYAAVAIQGTPAEVVNIVSIDSAIAKGLASPDHFVQLSDVLVSTIPRYALGAEAHTITIADNYLYVATQQRYIDIWDLSNPSSPSPMGAYTMPDPVLGTDFQGASVHEMYVDATGGASGGPRAYVAYTRGGLWIVDIDLSNIVDTSYVVNQMYHSDRRYADQVFSSDTAFDWRLCHSAWPIEGGDYVITTDEISLGATVYPRQGAVHNEYQAPNLKVWKNDQIGPDSASGLKGSYFVPNGSETGSISASSYSTSISPNSIHQLHTRDGYAYVSHYTQGFRVLDISNPESISEVGYYNAHDSLTSSTYSNDWGEGIYGVYPDENRTKLCYAGGESDGLSIFKLYHETLSDTIYSIKRVNLDGNFTVTEDTYISPGTLVNLNSNSVFRFDTGRTLYVDGELLINSVDFDAQFSRIVCRAGGKIVFCPEAFIEGINTMIIDSGGVLEVKSGSVVRLPRDAVIKIRGIMEAGLTGSDWARFESSSGSAWNGIVFDSISIAQSELSKLSNLYIHGAKSGITTDHAQPTITNCTFNKNEIGITVFSDSPYLTNNRIDGNSNIGLLGYYMSTVVDGNRMNRNNNYGALLYHCGNLWTDNRVDSNSTYGVFGDDLYLPFNSYNAGACDTTNGNSMRWNNAGVHVQHKSAPTFECDNSVHSNTVRDFVLRDTSTVYGDSNYPDQGVMSVDVDTYSQFTWTNAVANESVLYKTNATQSPVVQRHAIDPRYTVAFNQGLSKKRSLDYSDAVAGFSSALTYVQTRWEAEVCLVFWQQVFMDACCNKPSNDQISSNPVPAEAQFVSTLTNIRQSNAQPDWLRNTATEFLADFHAARSNYPTAIPLYQELAGKTSTEPLIARRAHLALVILKHRGMKDWDAAYEVYEDIASLYPATHEEIFAKIDLGLPLTEADSTVIRTMPKASRRDRPEEITTISEYTLDDIYPNPFNPSTTIVYSMKDDAHARISVQDMHGREVAVVLDEVRPAGSHTVSFDAGDLPSGIYLCKFETGDVRVIRKMTLAK
jgi:hypothetical protein